MYCYLLTANHKLTLNARSLNNNYKLLNLLSVRMNLVT